MKGNFVDYATAFTTEKSERKWVGKDRSWHSDERAKGRKWGRKWVDGRNDRVRGGVPRGLSRERGG